MDTAPDKIPTLTSGDKVVITKGCAARQIVKGAKALIHTVSPLGADYSHMVKVVLTLPGNRNVAFYVRHMNHLADEQINMNDGRPEHRISVRRA